LAGAAAGGLTDADLLERFVRQRDEAAFEVLVWRHGPKVLGVCRRTLGHEQDAEDAFQATFLVLARRANSISRRQAVASWLYQVAYRAALRAKARAPKRGTEHVQITDLPAPEQESGLVWRDLGPVLDEEVNRLPEKYRAPFVLCYLDGMTNEEAARQLGCPKGTVLSRLSWARDRLRARLTRRGLALSAGVLSITAATNEAGAALPPALVVTVLRAALSDCAGRLATAGVSSQVALLCTGVMRTMFWYKIKIVACCVLSISALGIAGGALTRQALTPKLAAAPMANLNSPQIEEPDQPPEKPEAAEPAEKTYKFEMGDKPWGAVLQWLADQTGMPVMTVLKPSGKLTFVAPKSDMKYTMGNIVDLLNEALVSQRLLLIRGNAVIRLVSANKKIDPDIVPQIRLDGFARRGRTELVSIVFPLNGLKGTDIAFEIKKMMGPFGEVIVLKSLNRFVLQDTAGNLQQICEATKDLRFQQILEGERSRKDRTERPEAPKRIEKTYTFKMRDQPWASVLEWLADETGLPVITEHKPTGTLTFIAPKRNNSYTIGDVFDILNEALASQKLLLIRRTSSITIVPADEKIDPAVLPRIQVDELATRGRTEPVQIVLPLHGLKAEEVEIDIKKMLGPQGEAMVLKGTNQLLLLDAAGNLRRICEIVKQVDVRPALERDRNTKDH